MKKLLRTTALTIAGLALTASLASAATVKMKFASHMPEAYPVNTAMKVWKDYIEGASKGNVSVQLSFGGAMGKTTEIVQYLQEGAVSATVASTSFMAGFERSYDIFNLPYLFKSVPQMLRAVDGPFGDYIKEKTEALNMYAVGFLGSGERSVYTKNTPIYTPADMKGIKIRVMSDLAVNTMNALGANGVPIPWTELYTSLQTGVVDAAENNPPSIVVGKHYEVCKFYSLTRHFDTPDVLLVSKIQADKWPEKERALILDSLKNVYLPVYEHMFAQATKKHLQFLLDNGMKINEVNDIQEFMDLTANVRIEAAKKIGMDKWVKVIQDTM